MQFRVVIPEHVKAGQTIRIHCPDGTEANVKVPKGLKTGDSFIFEMSVDQLNNPQALLESLKESTNSSGNAGNSQSTNNNGNSGSNNNNNNKNRRNSKANNSNRKSKNSNNSNNHNNSSSSSSSNNNNNNATKSNNNSKTTSNKKKGFLDREIVNLQDFVLALCVGLVIGFGIVLGFLVGVLWVTEDIGQSPSPANGSAAGITTGTGVSSSSRSFMTETTPGVSKATSTTGGSGANVVKQRYTFKMGPGGKLTQYEERDGQLIPVQFDENYNNNHRHTIKIISANTEQQKCHDSSSAAAASAATAAAKQDSCSNASQ